MINEDDLKLIVQNLLNTDFGKEYLKLLIQRTGVLNRSINFENVNKNYFIQGKNEIGNLILDDILKFAPYEYKEFV